MRILEGIVLREEIRDQTIKSSSKIKRIKRMLLSKSAKEKY